MNAKCKCFFQRAEQSKKASIALLILRVIVGLAFVIHGWQKMHNPMGWMGPNATIPGIFQLLATISEFGGGIAFILGLLTPLAAIGVLCTMTVAVFSLHFKMGAPFVSLTGAMSFELPLSYWAAALVLFLVGPGRFSLDTKLLSLCEQKNKI